MNRRGFTLIESMTVVLIIGILASLSAYGLLGAQRAGRDAKRKSDLTAISLAFQARYEDKTCPLQDQQVYPGVSTEAANGQWRPIRELSAISDGCGPFTDYLRVVPTDPRYDTASPYLFNLPNRALAPAKHYRLGAKLEGASQSTTENSRMSQVWKNSLNGADYPLNPPQQYNYFVGN